MTTETTTDTAPAAKPVTKRAPAKTAPRKTAPKKAAPIVATEGDNDASILVYLTKALKIEVRVAAVRAGVDTSTYVRALIARELGDVHPA